MVMYMKDSGKMIWRMVMVCIRARTEIVISVNGRKINSTARELRYGQINPNTMVTIKKARKVEKEN